jgi:RNA polymerase sigma factor for flagellar operon FliA
MQYERDEVKNRVRNAIATLPPREQRVIALYYYNEVTMKDIGAELGVNESRVSQLHARAIRRLREALGAEVTPVAASAALRDAIAAMEAPATFAPRAAAEKKMAKASLPESDTRVSQAAQKRAGLVLVKNNQGSGIGDQGNQDKVSRAARSKSPNLKGLESQRQPVSSRNRSASVPATSPVTKITRRARAGVAAAIAR